MSQIPTPAPGSVESWLWSGLALVAGAVVVLTGLNQWKQLFKKEPKRDEEPVTRLDLDKHLKESDEARDKAVKDMAEKLRDIIARLDRWEATIQVAIQSQLDVSRAKIERVEQDGRDGVHKVRDMVQATDNRVALLNNRITDVLQASINGVASRLDKTESVMERTQSALSRLGSTVSGLMGETGKLRKEFEKKGLYIVDKEDEDGT